MNKKKFLTGILLTCLLTMSLVIAARAAAKPAVVTLKKQNTWKQGRYTYSLFSGTLKNSSGALTADWALTFTFNKKVKKTDGWNAAYSGGNKKTLKISPADYNRRVRAGDTAAFGFIVRSKGKPAWKKVKIVVTANGLKSTYTQKKNGKTSKVRTVKVKETGKTQEAKAAASAAADSKNTSSAKGSAASSAAGGMMAGPNVSDNGRLRVSGTSLVNKNGKKIALKGVSTHGINWYPDYVNKDTFRTLRDEWGVNCIRLAMYTEEYNGYCAGGDKTALENLLHKGVQAATELGMYVIIDWHILSDADPRTHQTDALKFFEKMSKKYKNYENVIYEICNEPNGNVTWKQIKSYAEKVIGTIRKNDKNNLILVGTPTWSQRVDSAAADPIKGYSNVMYTLHFYAGTHGESLRGTLKSALNAGLPVFVSEFGISDASGNGALDKKEGEKWISYLKQNGISYVCWNLSNKDESSALLKKNCGKISGFTDTDLSEQGVWYKYLS